jgi:hypothetical protein
MSVMLFGPGSGCQQECDVGLRMANMMVSVEDRGSHPLLSQLLRLDL